MVVGAVFVADIRGTQDAVANGDTRTLRLYHTHTRESIEITFKREGRYDEEALRKLNWFLRDWRIDKSIRMDPRLFDVVWEVYRETGGSQPVHVVSAFRAPQTNNMLRSRSSGVAKNSQHTLGRAMDLFIPGVPVAKIREAGLRLQRGGVGFYPTSGSPFVHLDVGNVRHWPRMTHAQLARVFPDGRTVHIPSDGKPLAGYQLALADLQHNGATTNRRFDFSGAQTAEASAPPSGGGFFRRLFGSQDEDRAAPARIQTAARTPARAAPPEPAAAPVPMPSARPATMLAALEPAPAAPEQPAGPHMIWSQGPAPASAAALVAASYAPALPAPRPGAEAPSQVTAFAAPVPAPIPAVLRADGRMTALAAASLGPLRSGPPTARVEPVTGRAALDPAQVTRAAEQAVGSLRLSLDRRASRARAPLITVALDAETLPDSIRPTVTLRDAGPGMRHPDQHAIAPLLDVPPAVLAAGFGRTADGGLRTDAFRGRSAALLQTRMLIPPPAMEALGSIRRHGGRG